MRRLVYGEALMPNDSKPPARKAFAATESLANWLELIRKITVSLAVIAANNTEAQRCMAQQWLAFALGRALADADTPSLDDSAVAFTASGFNLRELIAAVLISEAFLSR